MSNITFRKRYSALIKEDAGCWLWTGSINADGYGRVNVTYADGKRTTKLIHILAWEWEHPDTPRDGVVISHLCANRNCCNPNHLAATPKNRRAKELNTGMNSRMFWYRYGKLIEKDAATGCWFWKGHKNASGYGKINVKRDDGVITSTYIHILSFEVANPDISREGMDVSHICHHNNCCNPQHLILATHRDNMRMNLGR